MKKSFVFKKVLVIAIYKNRDVFIIYVIEVNLFYKILIT